MTVTAHSLAVLLWSRRSPSHEFDHRLHDVIAALYATWSDARKADLYARIAEAVKPDMRYASLALACSICTLRNKTIFG